MTAPTSHLLTFLLPGGARADRARDAETVYGCNFEIGYRIGLVSIYGRTKEAVFVQAAKLLELACANPGRYSIAANLYVDPGHAIDETRDWLMVGGTVDSWTIVVIDGQAAFAPTSLGAEFPFEKPSRSPPAAAVRS